MTLEALRTALKQITDAMDYPNTRGPEGPKALVSCRALMLVTERLAALEAASTDGEGWVRVPVEVIKFLNGERPLDGKWFGDEPIHPNAEPSQIKRYWWRKYLPKTDTLSPAPASKGTGFASFKDEVEQFRRECVQMGHVEGAFILRLCDAALTASKVET